MSASNHEKAQAYYDEGNGHYFAERYHEAIIAFSQAIALNPQHKWAYDRRGSAYKSLHQYDEALENYNRALEIDPTFDNAYRNRAHVFRHNNFLRAAIADFECAKLYSASNESHKLIDAIVTELKAKLNR